MLVCPNVDDLMLVAPIVDDLMLVAPIVDDLMLVAPNVDDLNYFVDATSYLKTVYRLMVGQKKVFH